MRRTIGSVALGLGLAAAAPAGALGPALTTIAGRAHDRHKLTS